MTAVVATSSVGERGLARSEYSVSTSGSMVASTASTASTTSSSSSLGIVGEDVRSCGYCANIKLLRDILPPKRCDYCHELKCQFCTLKFPLVKVKKVLPKSMKGNTRICLSCFSQRWQENGMTTSSRGGKKLMDVSSLRQTSNGSMLDSPEDDAGWASRESFDEAALLSARDGLVTKAVSDPVEATDKPVRVVASRELDVWLSLLTAAMLVVITLTDGYSIQHRAAYAVATTGVFLLVHPWIRRLHTSRVAQPAMAPTVAHVEVEPPSTATDVVVKKVEPVTVPGTMPDEFRPVLQRMEDDLAYYLSDDCPWKLVRTAQGGKVFETSREGISQPVFKIELFVPGISMRDFFSFLQRNNLKDRALWDWNCSANDYIVRYPKDGVSVVYNAQKAFLGGFVSARDFSLLYKQLPNSTVYSSIVHPSVPEKPNATRGHVFFSCVHGVEKPDEDGFHLMHIVHVNIGGSIPHRLSYNGQIDNMEKMIKVFKNAKKVFAK